MPYHDPRSRPLWLAALVLAILGAGILGAVPLLEGRMALAGPEPALAAPPPNDRLGMVWINCPRDEQAWSGFTACQGPGGTTNLDARYQRARDAGAAWNRWAMYWPDIQSGAGVFSTNPADWDWSYPDSVIERNRLAGIRSAPVLLNTPYGLGDWSRNVSSGSVTRGNPPRVETAPRLYGPQPAPPSDVAAGCAVDEQTLPPRNLYLSHLDPNNYWANFVYHTVLRYKDRVSVWEIGNEPDLIHGNCPFFWNGSIQDWVRFLQVGYLSVKRADPGATVLFSGLAYWRDEGFLGRALEKGAGPYFDVLPMHFYSNPYHLPNFAHQFRQTMAQNGVTGKAIWMNETNIALCERYGCPSQNRGTAGDQASFIIQSAALALVSGVDKVFGFQAYDDGNEEWFGYVDNAGNPRPSYTAFQLAARFLRNSLVQITVPDGSPVERILLDGQSNGRVWVLWNNSWTPRSTTIPAALASATVWDRAGNSWPVVAQDGTYTLTLPGRTNPEVPGAPLIVVEPVNVMPDPGPPGPVAPCWGSAGGPPAPPPPGHTVRAAFPVLFKGCGGQAW